MAALTDAMKWYNLGGQKAARTKYHFKVEFFSSKYTSSTEDDANLQAPARLIFDTIRTVELPKYSIETEVINAWNVRQLVPTKIVFEPISISFNDTLDNRFQKFIKGYLDIISGSFKPQTKSLRKKFDQFGLYQLENDADCPIDKIEITRFYGADRDRENLLNKSKVTLWRPKIVDVQHDTLDYSASEAITWQISLRYESVTYEEEQESNLQAPPVREEVEYLAPAVGANAEGTAGEAQAQAAERARQAELNALRSSSPTATFTNGLSGTLTYPGGTSIPAYAFPPDGIRPRLPSSAEKITAFIKDQPVEGLVHNGKAYFLNFNPGN